RTRSPLSRQRFDAAPSARGDRFDEPASIAGEPGGIEAYLRYRDSGAVQGMRDRDRVTDRAQNIRPDAPEMMPAADPFDQLRAVLQSSRIEPGRRWEGFGRGEKTQRGFRRLDPSDRAGRGQITIGEAVHTMRAQPAPQGGERGGAGARPHNQDVGRQGF